MKKIFYLALVLILVSCASTKSTDKKDRVYDVANCVYPDSPQDKAPDWVCNETIKGYEVAAVGISEKSAAGFSFMEQMAVTNARVKLAQQIKVQVQNMIKQYAEVTGISDEQTVDKVNTSVTKQITNESIIGTRIVKKITSPRSSFYVLVAIDKKNFKILSEEAIDTSINNDEALWQQFKASQGQDELAKSITDNYKKD